MRTAKKHILIVSYHFPPGTSIGGLRACGLAKYLDPDTYEVTVVTAQAGAGSVVPGVRFLVVPWLSPVHRAKGVLGVHPNSDVLEMVSVGQSGLKRFLVRLATRLQPFVFWPDEYRGWGTLVVKTVVSHGAKFDTLITTGPPFSCHWVGMKIKRLGLCMRWIADFRDLWTLSSTYDAPALTHVRNARMERQIVAKADVITTTTTSSEVRLRKRYPRANVTAIYNGYDPEMARQSHVREPKVEIIFAGTLYSGRRDPSMLLRVLRGLIDSGAVTASEVGATLLCPPSAELQLLVSAYGVTSVVSVEAMRPRDEVHELLARADILLLLLEPGELASEALSGKVFEYLMYSGEIVAIGAHPGGEVDRLLQESGAGRTVADDQELRGVILEHVQGLRSNVRRRREPASWRYSQLRMAAQFSSLLDAVIAGNEGSRSQGSVEHGGDVESSE